MWKFGLGAWLAVLLVAQPAEIAAQPIDLQHVELQHLEQRLAATARENPGEYGIAALDLTTGLVIGVNTEKAFPMASTMKIAVAAAYLAEVDAGRRSLDEAIGGFERL
jgi:beta-lactamase class A